MPASGGRGPSNDDQSTPAADAARGAGATAGSTPESAGAAGGMVAVKNSSALRRAIYNSQPGAPTTIDVQESLVIDAQLEINTTISITSTTGAALIGNASRLFFVQSGGSLWLETLVLTSGDAFGGDAAAVAPSREWPWANGGAVLAERGAHVTVRDCVLTQNRAFQGGALSSNGGTLVVWGSEFRENSASTSSGAGGGAVFVTRAGALVATSTLFERNVAGLGGALAVANDSSAALDDVSFLQNSAAVNGGALILTERAHADLSRCSFMRNTASELGGGAHLKFGSALRAVDTTFDSNAANDGFGGAIFAYTRCNVSCARSRFLSNAAGWSGGAILVWDRSAVELEACEFAHNAAPFNGGAIEAHSNCSLVDTGSRYVANGARDGGASLLDEEPTFVSSWPLLVVDEPPDGPYRTHDRYSSWLSRPILTGRMAVTRRG